MPPPAATPAADPGPPGGPSAGPDRVRRSRTAARPAPAQRTAPDSDDLLDTDDLVDSDGPVDSDGLVGPVGPVGSDGTAGPADLAGDNEDSGDDGDGLAGGRDAGPVRSGQPAALTERELAILAFERQWWKHAGAKEQAIRDTFDLSATRYYQMLNALLDNPAAAEADAMLVGRLRRLRASRSRSRRR
jgi:hypothetical protein